MDASDYIGGNYVTALGFNAALPKLLPDLTNADISLFLDTGNVWGIDYDTNIDESNKLRSAFGVSLRESVKKRDQTAAESFKYMMEKTKGLSF